MSRREPWIYAALLALTLALAWVAWKGDPPASSASVLLFEADAAGVQEVAWRQGDDATTLTITGDPDHRQLWIVAQSVPPKPPEPPTPKPPEPKPPEPDTADAGDTPDAEAPDAEAPDAAPPAPEPTPPPAEPTPPAKPIVRAFPGGPAALKLLEDLDKLRALRRFEDVPADRLKAMGLDAPRGSLKLRAGGRELDLELGAEAYGSPHVYARQVGHPQEVYLLSSSLLGPLKSPGARLMERRILTAAPAEIAALTLQTPAGSARALPREGDTWAWADAPDAPVDALAGLMERLAQLSVLNVPPQGEAPEDSRLDPVLRVELKLKDAPPQTLELARGERQGIAIWYARTTATRAWVEVGDAVASDVADGAAALLPR